MLTRRAALLRLGLLAALIGAAFAAIALTGDISVSRVRRAIDGTGAWGPILFVLLSSSLTVALFPGPLLSGASGLLFGVAWGTLISIVSATLGAVLAFSISRRFGARPLEAIAGPRLRALTAWVGERGFLSVFYARLMPGVPYNLVNYAAGLAPVTLGAFALATVIGISPRAFAYTALGGSFTDLSRPEAIAAGVVLVLMAVIGLTVAYRDRERRRRERAEAAAAADPSPESETSTSTAA